MENIKVRDAAASDLSQVYSLVGELAAFEKEPDEPTVSLEKFKSDFKTGYECLVAELDGRVIGIALYFWGYSTWKGKMLYLDDLVVRNEFRKRGVGSRLFNKFMEIAREKQAGQVRWQVLDWNEPAIQMYKKAGADIYTDWWTCKLEKESIDAYREI